MSRAALGDLPRVLVVDDVPANLLAMRVALDSVAVVVDTVESGQDALKILLRNDYAVVLMDVNMPGMDGIEAARLMRAQRRFEELPIIFVTGMDEDPSRTFAGYGAGAVDYLIKPVDPQVLRGKVEVFARLDRQRRSLESAVAEQERVALRLRHANQELQQAQQEAVRAHRAKSSLIANVSHELRTPVTSIIASLEMLHRGVIAEEDKRAQVLEIALRNAKRLSAIVNDVLALERASSERMTLELGSVRARELVDSAYELHGPLADAWNVRLVRGTIEDAGIYVDSSRIEQVFANLVSNACKVSPAGGIVEVGVERRGARVRFYVKDGGPGLKEDQAKQLFERFETRVTGERNATGTGLGLHIARQLVVLHDGQIGVDSQVGEGAVFWFELPVVESRDADVNRRPTGD